MILENKKLFFKTIFLIFEDNKIENIFRNKKYSSIVAISRTNFPDLSEYKRIKTTSVIDLNQKEEGIFSSFSDTTRNEIRRTSKIPELKFVSVDQNKKEIHKLYREFEYAQDRVPFPLSNMENCLIFSAYLDGELISAMYVDTGGKDLRLRYVFSRRLKTEDHELKKMISFSSRRLIWEIILWGKKNNFRSLDMATVNLTDKEKEGITKFKMSFGGALADEYTYIYRSKIFVFFQKLAVIKNVARKIFNL